MNKISKCLITAASALILVFAAAAVILYAEGFYEISGISFAPHGNTESGPEETPGAVLDGGDLPQDEIQNVGDIMFVQDVEETEAETEVTAGSAGDAAGKPETTAQNHRPRPSKKKEKTGRDAADELFKKSVLEKQGFSLTDTFYDRSTHLIADVPLKNKVPNTFSFGKVREYRTDYKNGTPLTEGGVPVIQTERIRPVLEPYMGNIIYYDGRSSNLMNSDGRVVLTAFDVCTPAYMRDQSGRALYYYNSSLYSLAQDGTYQINRSGYNDAFAPPLKFDYPYGYGGPHCGLYLYYVDQKVQYVENQTRIDRQISLGNEPPEPVIAEEDARLYGFINASGEVVIKAQYYFASNFNENGIAVVGDRDRNVWLINQHGSVINNPYGTILYLASLNRRPVIDSFSLPDTDGKENLGMFYFDHGLMRIRRTLIDYYDHSNIVGGQDILISKNGTEFEIPGGYTLKYYSDGILILEKEGKYGAYSKSGHWIAQPVYTFCSEFREGLCVIGYKNGRKALIDTEGSIVLPFVFDYISTPSDGVITAYDKESGWHIFNKMAKIKK